MPLLNADGARLVVIDVQARLMPAIQDAVPLLANIRKLVDGAGLLGIPALLTEQNPAGLGATVPELAGAGPVVAKMSFDASAEPAFLDALAEMGDADGEIVLCGCEAHVCVAQTALGLAGLGRRVVVAEDAIGSRVIQTKDAALRRMLHHGIEVVTTEMVLFEWLRSAAHPRFREMAKLIR